MRANIPKGMGGGPQNMNAMLRQAQKMQEDMAALQEDLDAREYDISAGGGAVGFVNSFDSFIYRSNKDVRKHFDIVGVNNFGLNVYI